MTFEKAFALLELGLPIRRTIWDNPNKHVYLEKKRLYLVDTGTEQADWIGYPWKPIDEDPKATDWEIVRAKQ